MIKEFKISIRYWWLFFHDQICNCFSQKALLQLTDHEIFLKLECIADADNPILLWMYCKIGFSDWLQCPSGYYADTTGKITCTICPAGSSCSDPTVAPVACSSGQVYRISQNSEYPLSWYMYQFLIIKSHGIKISSNQNVKLVKVLLS